jgi:hypothetical protein
MTIITSPPNREGEEDCQEIGALWFNFEFHGVSFVKTVPNRVFPSNQNKFRFAKFVKVLGFFRVFSVLGAVPQNVSRIVNFEQLNTSLALAPRESEPGDCVFA